MISVITPTYNSERTIVRAYNSLLSQSTSDWEWIVIDDFSGDSTTKLVHDISCNDSRVTLLRNELNEGSAEARNRGLLHAKGQFVCFLDSDDEFLPDKLWLQKEYMVLLGLDFSFTSYLVYKDGRKVGEVDVRSRPAIDYEDLLRKMSTVGCSTVMLKRSFVGDRVMPNLRTGQDYAFWLSLLRNGGQAVLLPKLLTRYHITKGSISRNKLRKALRQWEIYTQVERIGFFNSMFCFIFYAWNAVLKK